MAETNAYRITVLTSRLIRLEYQPDHQFEDRPTQAVVNRTFPQVQYETREEAGNIILETEHLLLTYDRQRFSTNGLSIEVKSLGTRWNYSVVYGNSDENLFGTARTLDATNGYTELSPGIFGRRGYAVMDDSDSAILFDGEFLSRSAKGLDLYFFGYGRDYYGGLKDFFHLCGKAPMVPRYALGNWWSRYYRYTEDSYRELLDRFREEEIPLSVAVLDMDWHLTKVDGKYGTGWTGYTWDEECFPDYRRFLRLLKERKLAATLNLHPADGIRAFEAMYPQVAARMGIDPDTEKAVEFDFSDPAFREVYFDEVIHPYEDAGVDFWWIDWQQGTKKGNSDVDPLVLLNHYHYKDQEGRSVRPMIFSRYAGVGSHRYPVGFSGDTFTTWGSLSFQPYFTSAASNIGYGWWSHDIGGHMLGDKDLERLVRWIQFGVFSPIMRIHSSNNPFFRKEPWNLEEPYRSIAIRFLRLRHRLLPYLYTMMHVAYEEDRPLIQPMYYLCPEDAEAYAVPNEYGFGSSLLVGAITEPEDRKLQMASVSCLIPEGRWYDLLNGRIYQGRQKRKLYRSLYELPVLLSAGGILPESLEDRENGTENPASMCILFGTGADGEFALYEDDGRSMAYLDGECVTTCFEMKYDSAQGAVDVTIYPAKGTLSLIPAVRAYTLKFYGLSASKQARAYSVNADGTDAELSCHMDEKRQILTVELPQEAVTLVRRIRLEGFQLSENNYRSQVFEILDRAWIESTVKERIFNALEGAQTPDEFQLWLSGADVAENLKDAIREVL